MKLSRIVPSLSVLLALSASTVSAQEIGDLELAARLQKRITAYHKDAEPNGETLRLVYFYPGDIEPQKDYRARVQRMLEDMRDFYDEGIRKAGLTANKLPLEMDGDKLVIHLVKGRGKSDDYTHENSARVRREMQAALRDKIDFSTDFVLVLGGMCQKRGENHYYFHAPYYGDGRSSQKWGLCYAADCEILDTRNLTKEKANEQMRYEEHYGDYRKSVARFNSWYLGGIAHELGHAFSLPHNGQLPAQLKVHGNALMGGGNHTYGDDRWGGGKGAFMTLATSLRLAVHPLFNGSDRERFAKVTHAFEDLQYESAGKSMTIRGKATGSPEPIAVIAYCDPPGGAGYNALTWVGEVGADGQFVIEAKEHTPGPHELRLTMVHLNGATNTMHSGYPVNAKGEPDVSALAIQSIIQPAETAFLRGDRKKAAGLARRALANEPMPAATARLKHIVALEEPPAPIDLAGFKGDRISLSDVKWKSAQVGWGKPTRNHYLISPTVRDGVFLEVGGAFFEKGLYAHAPSEYVFELDGSWKTFEATVGLQAGVGSKGRSRFIVKGDGKVLFTSKHLKGDQSQEVRIDIEGARELELVVESGIRGNPECWSIWGAPTVSR